MKYLKNYHLYSINEYITDEVNRKLRKAILWLNIYKGFYGELLSHLNVYGSLRPRFKTMCTDCETFIAVHPEFATKQSEKALRLVFAHEILHVIARHNQRMGDRNHEVWDQACDFAINPILKSDPSFGKDWEFPVGDDGKPMGLWEERFVGMRAEDIYDVLVSEGALKKTNPTFVMGAKMGDMTKGTMAPEEGMILQIRKEDATEDDDDTIPAGEDKPEEERPNLIFSKDTQEGGIPDAEEIGKKTKRTTDQGDLLKGDVHTHQQTGRSKIRQTATKTNWDILTNQAMARNSDSLGQEAKKLLLTSIGDKPLVNWKSELKRFFDQSLTGREYVLPNKRLLASGRVAYGIKKSGISTLKTIVCAVDTSSSISQDQIKTFLNEVMYLCKKFDADKTIVIYCSDGIDGIDIIKKGKSPDFSKIASTGGNRDGFIPPFEWVEKNRIKPSVFIYLTDTGGEMPNKAKYGISTYEHKVIWFVVSQSIYTEPPFGKILYMPVAALK